MFASTYRELLLTDKIRNKRCTIILITPPPDPPISFSIFPKNYFQPARPCRLVSRNQEFHERNQNNLKFLFSSEFRSGNRKNFRVPTVNSKHSLILNTKNSGIWLGINSVSLLSLTSFHYFFRLSLALPHFFKRLGSLFLLQLIFSCVIW